MRFPQYGFNFNLILSPWKELSELFLTLIYLILSYILFGNTTV